MPLIRVLPAAGGPYCLQVVRQTVCARIRRHDAASCQLTDTCRCASHAQCDAHLHISHALQCISGMVGPSLQVQSTDTLGCTCLHACSCTCSRPSQPLQPAGCKQQSMVYGCLQRRCSRCKYWLQVLCCCASHGSHM